MWIGSKRTLTRPPVIALTALLLLQISATDARAEALQETRSSCAGEAGAARGGQTLSLATGFGLGLPIGPARGSDLEDSRFVAFLPRWGLGLSDCIGRGTWYRGSLRFALEGVFLSAIEPRSGLAAGLTPLLRYEFLRGGRIHPYLELGAGFVFMDFDLDRQRDGFNFTPQGGVGFAYRMSEQTDFTAGWRFHHISNANLRRPNTGLDDSLFLLGVTYHLGR